jgi:hypothetical protein
MMAKYSFYILIALIILSCTETDLKIRKFVDSELSLYPESRLTDIYKSFFQDAYGPDHLIPDTTRAGIFLSRELAHEDWPDTLRFQPTGVEHDYIRVNLMMVKNGGYFGDADPRFGDIDPPKQVKLQRT